MRAISLVALTLIPVLTLTACASDGRPSATSTRLDRLRHDCEARGGSLVPSGRLTGEEALDNPCLIRGGGTALPPAQ